MKTFIIGVVIAIIIAFILLLVFALCNISGKASRAEEALHEKEEAEN